MLRSVLVSAVVLGFGGSLAIGDDLVDQMKDVNSAFRIVDGELVKIPTLQGLDSVCRADVIVEHMVVEDRHEGTVCEGLTQLLQLEIRKSGIIIVDDKNKDSCLAGTNWVALGLEIDVIETSMGSAYHHVLIAHGRVQVERSGISWMLVVPTWRGVSKAGWIGSDRDLCTKLRQAVIGQATIFANEWLAANPPGQEKKETQNNQPPNKSTGSGS